MQEERNRWRKEDTERCRREEEMERVREKTQSRDRWLSWMMTAQSRNTEESEKKYRANKRERDAARERPAEPRGREGTRDCRASRVHSPPAALLSSSGLL